MTLIMMVLRVLLHKISNVYWNIHQALRTTKMLGTGFLCIWCSSPMFVSNPPWSNHSGLKSNCYTSGWRAQEPSPTLSLRWLHRSVAYHETNVRAWLLYLVARIIQKRSQVRCIVSSELPEDGTLCIILRLASRKWTLNCIKLTSITMDLLVKVYLHSIRWCEHSL